MFWVALSLVTPPLHSFALIGAQKQARVFRYVRSLAQCVHFAPSCSIRPFICCFHRDGRVVVLHCARACMGVLFSWRLHTSLRRNIRVCLRSSSHSWCSLAYLALSLGGQNRYAFVLLFFKNVGFFSELPFFFDPDSSCLSFPFKEVLFSCRCNKRGSFVLVRMMVSQK